MLKTQHFVFEQKLQILDSKRTIKAKSYSAQLPSLTPSIKHRLSQICTPRLLRIVFHLWNYQGASTYELYEATAISNVIDCVYKESGQQLLQQLGIKISFEVEPTKNKFGHKTLVEYWFLEICDFNKLVLPAANDAEYQDFAS